tara:strand:- start:3275 stop:3862 length:588 start_codon:yes stop_codon:yes gene_type:complete
MTRKIINIIFFILIASKAIASEDSVLKIGNEEAKITVKVFSSLTCPHCATFHLNIYSKLKNQFIDKNLVKFEHHGFPLDLAALNAEKILRCEKNNQLKFQLLSEIYKKQNKWASGSDIKKINEMLINVGEASNLSKENMHMCLEDEKLQDIILEERINAQKKYKIQSTPTIFINEEKYEGKHNFKSFEKYLNKIL